MRAVCAALLLLLAANTAVLAHAFLVKSEPAVGLSVAAPRILRLEFSEPVELAFSGFNLASEAGPPVETGQVRYAGDDHKVLAADLPPLAPGAYRVRWHAVSIDTHRTEGDFAFTVKP